MAKRAIRSSWPAWFYGPNGASRVFEREEEVPEGWYDHPAKAATPPPQETEPPPAPQEPEKEPGSPFSAHVELDDLDLLDEEPEPQKKSPKKLGKKS